MISTIDHVAFDCYKFDETLDFYTRVLGFEEMFRLYNDSGALWIIYLRVSDDSYIELFPRTGEAPPRSGSYSHLCLKVDDIEIIVQTINERGAKLDGQIRSGKDGNRQVWMKDPEGNPIEFVQRMPDSLQMRALERIKATKIAG
jgi:lactoylglutathione lyase